MKTKSLLSKTLWQFAVCMGANLALTTPLFYLLTKYFYAEDLMDIIGAVQRGEDIPPLDLEQDILEGMMLQLLLVSLVVGLSLFITMRFTTRRLLQPFDDTLQKVEQFKLTQDRLPQFLPTDIREFDRLNRSLERLMRQDQETFRIQKEFTENASHELQTPLAVIRAQLDLLLQENLTERQLQTVAGLCELTVRMSRLNRQLLLLAKIDNAQYAATEEVDVAALVTGSLPLYGVLQVAVSLQVDDCRSRRDGRVRANPDLLECLLKNLIVNAVRCSIPGGTVTVRIEDTRLTVSNASADSVPLDAATLFRRFRSGGDRQQGHGLGLAIVKAVCDFHGWTVDYRFADGRHQFVVAWRQEPS